MRTLSVFAIALALVLPAVVAGQTTPPGGTMQMNALPGKLNSWVFNGSVRVKITDVVDPKLANYFPEDVGSGYRFLVVHGIMANGKSTQQHYSGFVAYLSDADNITYAYSGTTHQPAAIAEADGYSDLPPGAATKLLFPFKVPSDFTPTKLLLVPQPRPNAGKPIRVTLK